MARITYEGIRDGSMTDESVCWGLHKATRELRDRWIRLSATARHGDKPTRNIDIKHMDAEMMAVSLSDGDHRDDTLPRDAVLCDEDDATPFYWVPYVHFGA
jgi:hypothetical protein